MQPTPVSPLWFSPVFRQYIWGGRRLGEVLGKPIGLEGRFAESWEVVDHGGDQSIVQWGWTDGPSAERSSPNQVKSVSSPSSLVNQTLGQIMRELGPAIVGPRCYEEIHSKDYPENLRGRFPLLVKWLDAQQNLSLQVHPNNSQAALQSPPDLGKSEAWYVADAIPGARVYAGLLPGVGRDECLKAMEQGRLRHVLHSFEPKIGDCIYIPAGTIHAIGAGLLVAEVQQASDTTYRLYDWDRVGDDGKPRALQVPQALAVANFQIGPVDAAPPIELPLYEPSRSGTNGRRQSLVQCPYFRLERITLTGTMSLPTNQCQILIGLHGCGRLCPQESSDLLSGLSQRTIRRGDSVLIPYACEPLTLQCDEPALFLLASLPN
ncbi:MAG: hypothetical protein JNL67_09110 [Planctomycetaceae bacterium]|nr:hypothetical protein [Planctomycetaceae bacterium]